MSDWTPPHYKSKASPGPWKWVPFKNWDGGLQASDGTWVISNDETDNTPENRHDATLIRLAPDMASMLRQLEDTQEICPICSSYAEEHALDCRLAKLLSELPE